MIWGLKKVLKELSKFFSKDFDVKVCSTNSKHSIKFYNFGATFPTNHQRITKLLRTLFERYFQEIKTLWHRNPPIETLNFNQKIFKEFNFNIPEASFNRMHPKENVIRQNHAIRADVPASKSIRMYKKFIENVKMLESSRNCKRLGSLSKLLGKAPRVRKLVSNIFRKFITPSSVSEHLRDLGENSREINGLQIRPVN